jgi:hypothetical protein
LPFHVPGQFLDDSGEDARRLSAVEPKTPRQIVHDLPALTRREYLQDIPRHFRPTPPFALQT